MLQLLVLQFSLVKFLANFDKTIKPVKPLLGVDIRFNTEIAKSVLKYDPIPIEKTLKDTSDFHSPTNRIYIFLYFKKELKHLCSIVFNLKMSIYLLQFKIKLFYHSLFKF